MHRVRGLVFAYENYMHFKRSARLSQPFVFTVSAFALGACGDTASISNPPPPDSGADVSTAILNLFMMASLLWQMSCVTPA